MESEVVGLAPIPSKHVPAAAQEEAKYEEEEDDNKALAAMMMWARLARAESESSQSVSNCIRS